MRYIHIYRLVIVYVEVVNECCVMETHCEGTVRERNKGVMKLCIETKKREREREREREKTGCGERQNVQRAMVTHTCTLRHTHAYIYMCVCVCVYMFCVRNAVP